MQYILATLASVLIVLKLMGLVKISWLMIGAIFLAPLIAGILVLVLFVIISGVLMR